jgi:chromosome segregation ATPase
MDKNKTCQECSNLVQRGSILCENCIAIKKSRINNKREQELDELVMKNKILEGRLKETENILKETQQKLSSSNIMSEQDIIQANKCLSDSEEKIKSLGAERDRLEKQLEVYTEKNRKLKDKLDNAISMISTKDSLIASKETQLNMLKNRENKDKDKETLMEALKNKEDIIKNLTTERDRLENKLSIQESKMHSETDETIKNLLDTNKNLLENNKNLKSFCAHIESENSRLSLLLEKQKQDYEELLRHKETYEMTYSQTKLDNEKLLLELERLKTFNKGLFEQNSLLTKENEELMKAMKKP